MDDSLISGLLYQLQGAPTSQIAQQLGVDPAKAQSAIASALPLMMGTMGHQAQQPGGADALLQALQQDHSGQGALDMGGLLGALTGGGQAQGGGLGGMIGGMLGNLAGGQQGQGGVLGGLGGMLGGLLGGGAQSNPQLNAGGILGHIFGDAQSHAQDGLGQATGLGAAKAGQLLMMLAPMVMAYLARHAQANNLDAGGLSAALGQAQNAAQSQSSMTGDFLNSVLNRL